MDRGRLLSLPYKTSTVVTLSVVTLVVCSVPVFGTRFLNDMGFYALCADKVLAGGLLYRDAMDVKPPLVFLHYALVFKVFGLNNMAAVKVVTMAWLGASAVIMAALRRALSPAAGAPAFVALLFVLASFSGWGQQFLSTNTEILANLFILGGVWLLVARDFSSRPAHLVLGGLCLGIACLYRNQSVAALLAYLATIVMRRRQFDHKLVRLLLVGVGFVVPLAAFVAYYAHLGALDDLRLLLAVQAHHTRDALDDIYGPELLGQALLTVSGLWPLLLLAGWQVAAIWRRQRAASRSEVFLVAFAFCSLTTFFLGGRLYPHYFVQAIPALVLLAADRLPVPGAAAVPSGTPRQTWFEARSFAIMVVVAGAFAVINGTYFWTRPTEPPRRDLVTFVDGHSTSSDEVLLWAWRPELLFQTNRRFATRQLVNGPLIGLPSRRHPGERRSAVPGLWSTYLRDLATAPPRLIFDAPPGRSEWPIQRFPQLAPLLAEYHPCRVIDDVCVYLRK